MNAELLKFTKESLEKNIPRNDIANALKQAGWDISDIRAAINSYANMTFAVPVPAPKASSSARDAFLYLVLFSMLCSINFNLCAVFFEFINRAFPDATQAQGLYGLFFNALRWNISSLIIGLPVFLYVFYITNSAITADPSRRNSEPRKWLTYITLYCLALSIVGDFVSLVYNMLGGELTSRFFLKTLVVAIVAGGNFFYFFWDMRQGEKR